jgi:eukaryotic-like serine/threonine-protein kinase
VMGTVGYMSPEQVRGQEADQRSDIFSLGVILYELLSGHRAFARETAAETLTAVLKEEPPEIRHDSQTIHPALDAIVKRCLEKSPGARFQSAHDLGFALSTVHTLSQVRPATSDAGQPQAANTGARSRARERAWWGAACVLLVLSTYGLTRWRGVPARPNEPVLRLALPPPDKTSFGTIAISPDGRWLAFTGATGARVQLWLRSLDDATERALAGTDGATLPFWSPDSRFVGFFASGQLRKVEISGGVPVALADVGISTGGAWNHDGVILFGSLGGAGLSSVAATGGAVVSVMRPELDRGESDYMNPVFLPDGRHFLFNIFSGHKDTRGVFLSSLDAASSRRRILSENTNAVYVPGDATANGHLLFVRESTLMAQPFDAATRETTGEAVPIANRVAASTFDGTSTGITRRNFTVSSNGILVFDDTPTRLRNQLLWVDRDGRNARPIDGMTDISGARLSPDGRRFAVSRFGIETGNNDIWVSDVDGGHPTRLTFDPANDVFPVWSPDGSQLVWASNRSGVYKIFRKASNGAGEDAVLHAGAMFEFPSDWSRDGRFILFRAIDPKTHYDTKTLEVGDPAKADASPLLGSEANEGAAVFSPNGRWLAYASDETSRYEVYVQRFPGGGGKRQISTGGAIAPTWRADGRELFFHALDGKLMTVSVSESESFSTSAPASLFEFRAGGNLMTPYYSATLDGQRFLLSAIVEVDGSAPLAVIINWTDLLRSRQ